MAKAKAAEAEVEEVTNLDHVIGGVEVWQPYRSVHYVRAEQFDFPFSLTGADGELMHGKAGDYILYGHRGDIWVEDREDFQARFRPLSPNKT